MIQQSPFIEQYLTPTLLNKPGPNEMPTERLQEFILDQITLNCDRIKRLGEEQNQLFSPLDLGAISAESTYYEIGFDLPYSQHLGGNAQPSRRFTISRDGALVELKSTYGAWTSQIEAVDEGTEEDWREHFKEMTATGMTAEIIAECSFANPNIWAFLASKPTMKSFDFAGHHHTIRDIDHRKGFLVRTTSDDKSVKQEWRNGPYIRSYRPSRANTVRLV